MLGMIGRRLVALVPVLLIVTFAVFMLSSLIPGDPAVTLAGGDAATPEKIEEVRTELGFDKPLIVQYGNWLADAARFEFGESLYAGGRITVGEEIRHRLPVTFSVAGLALLFGLVIAIPVGIVAGMKPGRLVDRLSVTGTSVGLAIPNFFLAMVLITLLARTRDSFFPSGGFVPIEEDVGEWLKHATLPALSLGVVSGASVARQLRAALIDVLGSNYVRTAWASGQRPVRVVGKYALKNAAIPAVTVIGLQLTFLLGGTVIIERLFGIPGMGSYMIQALTLQDLPVIQGVTMVFVLTTMTLTLLVDIAYGYLNPKVRVS